MFLIKSILCSYTSINHIGFVERIYQDEGYRKNITDSNNLTGKYTVINWVKIDELFYFNSHISLWMLTNLQNHFERWEANYCYDYLIE